MARIEIDAITDVDRRTRVRVLLPELGCIMKLELAIFQRAEDLVAMGFKAADAVHLAAAEGARADILLTCDDRMCRLAKRHRKDLRVHVANLVDWLKELENDDA